ncbi:MAG: hypothetical protein LC746_17660, partial [Acidobacteria bacterium]|nr:hypothetical protein [Acidobacteriota bacterium]
RRLGVSCALSVSLACACLAAGASAQRRKPRGASARKQYGKVCGDPTAACPTGDLTFEAYDLRFVLPKNAVIFESEEFYAVILKSARASSADDCDTHVPESERLAAQKLFPRRKVFASRCEEPTSLYYTNLAPLQRVMAVYAGATLEEAGRTLAEVKATGKFPGANLRRMRAGINGT